MENQSQPLNTGSTIQAAPNSTAILVLGILSIVFCWCYGVPGFVMGVIALVLSGKSRRLYADNPDAYEQGSVKNLNAGRVCAVIGTILSSLVLLVWLVYIIFLGAVLTSFPWEMMDDMPSY